jgi:hypothetical protein
VLATGLSLAAVKLLPQMEFTGAFPRPAVREGFLPEGLAVVFFDRQQELLYRAYRDVYLPPEHADLKTLSDSESLPIARRLADLGFHWGWHEYGCYITWLGMGLALLGIAAAWKSQWPMYVTGGIALILVMGHASPVNLYGWLQRLPLYASLHVPSRFLAVVLFALAIAAGHGLDWLCRRIRQSPLRRLETPFAWLIPAVIVAELAVMNWKLFDDIFIIRPRVMPTTERRDFATRVRTTAHRDPRMMSCLYPLLMSDTGVLEGYENLAVPRGRITLEGRPDYRGEAFLEQGTGKAEIQEWTMSRVEVSLSVDAEDQLVLNQNFSKGWKAVVRGVNGIRRGDAAASSEGLVSVTVGPEDREVEFRYLPESFVWGTWISGLSLLICAALLIVPKSLVRRAKSFPPNDGLPGRGSPQ